MRSSKKRSDPQATCPKDKSHTAFVTTAHVMQEWIVGGDGEWVSTLTDCLDVVHPPDHDNTWSCHTCGADAVWE